MGCVECLPDPVDERPPLGGPLGARRQVASKGLEAVIEA